jgi:hypothetical protein
MQRRYPPETLPDKTAVGAVSGVSPSGRHLGRVVRSTSVVARQDSATKGDLRAAVATLTDFRLRDAQLHKAPLSAADVNGICGLRTGFGPDGCGGDP